MGGAMTLLTELRDSAQKAFPRETLSPPRDASWGKVTELGWLMIELSEAQGGLGLGREATAAILFEQGRVLSTAPLIPALLGLQVIAACPSFPKQLDRIERICGGDYVPLHLIPAQIDRAGDGSLSGKIGGVFEADMAEHVIVGLADQYLLIPLAAPGVEISEQKIWDESRRLFDVTLTNFTPAPEHILARGDAAKAIHDGVSVGAQLALAADALGGANAIFEMTVDYLKMRKQFDRPLAMFQALKHRVADLKIALAAAEALLWARAAQGDVTTTQMGAMKALAVQTFVDVAEEAIQLHGGIGLTQEYPCHHFLKRAMLNRVLCGGVDHWEEQAGRSILATIKNA
jgi:alkylation response protein AidB-like acyl-CoA dehydrogenase